MTTSAFAKDGPYTGDGSANQAFSITFDYFSTSEVVATTRVTATGVPTTLVETTDYTISTSGSNPFTGGTLTLADGTTIASSSTLTISRAVDQNQEGDFEIGGTFPANTAEVSNDKLSLQIQDLQEQIDRKIGIPLTDGATQEASVELPNAIDRASTNLVFTGSGAITASSLVTPSATTVSAFGASLVDDASAAAARATLGLVIGTNVQAFDVALWALATLTNTANEIPMFTGSGNATTLDFYDEDDMASSDATGLASQQSIKEYTDAQAGAKDAGDVSGVTVDFSGYATGSWVDLDLSGGISGAAGVAVVVCCRVELADNVAGTSAKFRTKGNSNTDNVSTIVAPVANIGANQDIIVLTDTVHKVQILITSGASLVTGKITVKQVWKSR